MKFWFDKILVGSWLPEGRAGIWSIKKTVVPGNRLTWLANGGDEYGHELLAPGTYTGLFRTLDDGSEQRVMFDEPREIKEALAFVEKAKGKILVTGLGIGMVAAWLASKKEVTQVDVIEKNIDVINLVAKYLPSSKIRVIHADAFDYELTEKYDSAWHDCFYVIPENVEKLISKFPIQTQEIWTPGVLAQPVARRSFLRTALVAAAVLISGLSLSIPRKVSAAGITFIQETTGVANATFTNPLTTGNSCIIRVSCATTITSIAAGGAATKDVAQLGLTSVGVGEVSIWHVHNVTPASSVNVTPSGRGSALTVNAVEYSGLTNAAAEAINSNSNAASNTVTTNSVTPVSPASLVVAMGAWAANDYSSGPTNSFTRRTPISTTGIFQESADQIEAVAAAYSTGYGLTAAIAWAAAIAVFGGTASSVPLNGGIYFSGEAD